MILAWLAFYDGLLGVALVAAGIVAAHFGLTPPFKGFQIFLVGFFFAGIAIVLGILGMLLTRGEERRGGQTRARIGTILGLVVAAPIVGVVLRHRAVPINDITTDTQNPPQFVAALKLPANAGRDMAYNPKFAPIQKMNYPELAPITLNGTPNIVYKRIEILAGEIPNWSITRNDQSAHELEGVATSALFKFKDDFIIQVRPDGTDKSIVEMRSKSRDGVSDLGANYDRIMSFFRILKTGPRIMPPGSAQVQP
jgi:uncharacterized protein (DUF1499 family)